MRYRVWQSHGRPRRDWVLKGHSLESGKRGRGGADRRDLSCGRQEEAQARLNQAKVVQTEGRRQPRKIFRG